MRFEDCLSKGLIKKDTQACERVQSSLSIAKRFLTAAEKNMKIKEYEMSELASYNALFHAARALLFNKGYIERSHLCVIIALKELYKKNPDLLDLLNTFDKIRISRHNIQYGGELVQKTDAEFVIRFADQMLKKTTKILKETIK